MTVTLHPCDHAYAVDHSVPINADRGAMPIPGLQGRQYDDARKYVGLLANRYRGWFDLANMLNYHAVAMLTLYGEVAEDDDVPTRQEIGEAFATLAKLSNLHKGKDV